MYKDKTHRSISKSLKETYTGNNKDIPKNNILSSYIFKSLSNNNTIDDEEELIAKLEALDAIKDVPDKYYPAMAEIVTYIHNIDRKQNASNNLGNNNA